MISWPIQTESPGSDVEKAAALEWAHRGGVLALVTADDLKSWR